MIPSGCANPLIKKECDSCRAPQSSHMKNMQTIQFLWMYFYFALLSKLLSICISVWIWISTHSSQYTHRRGISVARVLSICLFFPLLWHKINKFINVFFLSIEARDPAWPLMISVNMHWSKRRSLSAEPISLSFIRIVLHGLCALCHMLHNGTAAPTFTLCRQR